MLKSNKKKIELRISVSKIFDRIQICTYVHKVVVYFFQRVVCLVHCFGPVRFMSCYCCVILVNPSIFRLKQSWELSESRVNSCLISRKQDFREKQHISCPDLTCCLRLLIHLWCSQTKNIIVFCDVCFYQSAYRRPHTIILKIASDISVGCFFSQLWNTCRKTLSNFENKV